MDKKMLTQKELLDMGWTKTMIERLLPEPVRAKNRLYANATPLKLYDAEIVQQVTQTNDYAEALTKANARRLASQKGITTKTNKLIDDVTNTKGAFDVKIIPDNKLRKLAIQAQRDWYTSKGDFDHDCNTTDRTTVERWIVNYIRHELTEMYDSTMGYIAGKTGKQAAYTTYKTEMLREIARAYPKYAVECERQIAGMSAFEDFCHRLFGEGYRAADADAIADRYALTDAELECVCKRLEQLERDSELMGSDEYV